MSKRSKSNKPPKIKGPSTTVTSVTSTTSVTLHSGGDIKGDLIIEPLGNGMYIYNQKGNRGIVKAEFDETYKKYYLPIGKNNYSLRGKPIKVPLFRVPSMEIANSWVKGKFKTKGIREIYEDLVEFYKTAYDLVEKEAPVILALRTLTTWFRDIINTFFYYAIDATMGAGKTSLLYSMSVLSKHGALTGDLTTPTIARAIDQQKLCLHIDEIDQISKEKKAEIEAILRKGYRKNNRYLRINPNTLDPESFEVHGAHAFSYRTSIEDALKDRTLPGRLRVSSDKTLPVLNYHVDEITRDLFHNLFFFYMERATSYASYEVTLVTQLRRGSLEDLKGKTVSERRSLLFNIFTEGFKQRELDLMDSLVGRNIELTYICLLVTRFLGLDLFDSLRSVMVSKQNEESVPDSFYLDKLKDFLNTLREERPDWVLRKGEFGGCFYYPKNAVFSEFVASLKKQDTPPIGTNRFNGLLKDLGFVDGLNWKNQKDLKGTSRKSLIFDAEIQRNLPFPGKDDKPPESLGYYNNPAEETLEIIRKSPEIQETDLFSQLQGKNGDFTRAKFDDIISRLKTQGLIFEASPGKLKEV